jgi:hypothetical protein
MIVIGCPFLSSLTLGLAAIDLLCRTSEQALIERKVETVHYELEDIMNAPSVIQDYLQRLQERGAPSITLFT